MLGATSCFAEPWLAVPRPAGAFWWLLSDLIIAAGWLVSSLLERGCRAHRARLDPVGPVPVGKAGEQLVKERLEEEDKPRWSWAKMLSPGEAAGRRSRVYKGQRTGFDGHPIVLPVPPFLPPAQSKRQPDVGRAASGSHRGIFRRQGGSEQ